MENKEGLREHLHIRLQLQRRSGTACSCRCVTNKGVVIMNEKEIEKIVANVKANQHFEGLEMTEQGLEDCRRVLRGEISADEIIKRRLQEAGRFNG